MKTSGKARLVVYSHGTPKLHGGATRNAGALLSAYVTQFSCILTISEAQQGPFLVKKLFRCISPASGDN